MNATIEQPPYYQKVDETDMSRRAMPEGTVFESSYFQFCIIFPPPVIDMVAAELSDSELLTAIDKSGTFDFLNSPEEDIYNDMPKKPE